MGERDYWLGFSVFSGIGPFKFKKILEEFGTAKKAWEGSDSKILKILGENLGSKFLDFRSKFSIENYLKSLKKENVWFLTLKDKDYPKPLLQISKQPFILYGKGDPKILSSTSFAVVGARRTTHYGREVTALFTQELVRSGFTIVSGLDMG